MEGDGVLQDFKQKFNVMEALNKQRLSSKLCDVILKVFDDQIHAHSNVLAAASPYFDALFSEQDLPRGFSPKNPQIIEIQIDETTDEAYKIAVNKVVDFMYTSQMNVHDGILTQVLDIARIMQMTGIIGRKPKDLSEFCELYQQGARSVIHKGCPNYSTIQNTKPTSETRYEGHEQTSSSEQFSQTSNGPNGVKRKRGRPRKSEQVQNNQEVSSNLLETPDEIKTEQENGDKKLEFEAVAEKETPLKVSKHGRVIKPRKFSDDIIRYNIKQGPGCDIETVNGSCDRSDEEKMADDDGEETDMKKDRRAEEIMVNKFTCELCDYEASNIKQFYKHNLEHLHADKKCLCGWVCEVPDETEQMFSQHLDRCGQKKASTFLCKFCSQSFVSKGKLLQHLPVHSKTKPFVCRICGASFRWKHALLTHKIVHKNSKEYLCALCGYATRNKVQLKAHNLIHSGNTFKCHHNGCEYQTTDKSSLKCHWLTHTREKPHRCGFCGQSFSLLRNMKRHRLLHRADRPYKCELCTFCTTRVDKLKEHQLKLHHIGEKPKRKFRVTDYLKNPSIVQGLENEEDQEQYETTVLEVSDCMETFEVQVAEGGGGGWNSHYSDLNLPSSEGEIVPITIIQNNETITCEILHVPAQLLTQEAQLLSQDIKQL